MRVLKKLLVNSLVMILATTAVFGILCGMLLHTAHLDDTDMRKSAAGRWHGVQFYLDGVKYVCAQGHPVTVELNAESVSIESHDLPAVNRVPCAWGGHSVNFRREGEAVTASLYYDEGGYLHMLIPAWALDLSLKADEAHQSAPEDGGE